MREYERLVVFFFGRLQGARGPGIVLLIPFVQQAVKVDLRERFLEVPQQTCITKDNAPINIDFLVYSKVFEPEITVTAVTDFTGASQALAATTLRAVIGDIPLDDVLAKREEINHILRAKLDEVTERWGVKITSVEIREIVPPRDIQEAMNRQMSAERNRRAVITESEGTRQATINVAEGDKQSNILRAEGDRQSQILRAEGFANALQTIFGAASGIDEKTMALQYLEALKTLAAGESTKWIVPMELCELTRPITAAMREMRPSGARRRLSRGRRDGMIRGVLRAVGRVIGLLTGAYLAFVAVRGSRLLVRPEVRPFLPDAPGAPATPADIGLEYEAVRFTTDDGVTLTGWLDPGRARDADRGDRDARVLGPPAAGAGGVRAVAARAPPRPAVRLPRPRRERGQHRSRSARTSGATWRRPCASWRAAGWDRSPCSASAWEPRSRSSPRPTCRWRRSSPMRPSPSSTTRSPTACGEVGYPLAALGARAVVAGAMLRTRSRLTDPLRAVARIAPRPLLLIAPREDRLISWRQSLRLYEAAGEPKELMVVEGAGHAEAYAVDPEAYRRRVLDFLERHLG